MISILWDTTSNFGDLEMLDKLMGALFAYMR